MEGSALSRGPGLAGADSPKRETAVNRELGKLDATIVRLQNICSDLVDRLHPVLAPEGPESSTDSAKTPPQETPLADTIHRQRVQLETLSDALLNITNRVEL